MPGLSVLGIVVLAVTAVAALLLVLWGSGLLGTTRRVIRLFWCPVPCRNVTAEFEEAVWDGKRLAVFRCSAFRPPTAVGGCAMECLGARLLPSVKSGAEAAEAVLRARLGSA